MKPEDVTSEMVEAWYHAGFYAVEGADARPLIAAAVNAAGAVVLTDEERHAFVRVLSAALSWSYKLEADCADGMTDDEIAVADETGVWPEAGQALRRDVRRCRRLIENAPTNL